MTSNEDKELAQLHEEFVKIGESAKRKRERYETAERDIDKAKTAMDASKKTYQQYDEEEKRLLEEEKQILVRLAAVKRLKADAGYDLRAKSRAYKKALEHGLEHVNKETKKNKKKKKKKNDDDDSDSDSSLELPGIDFDINKKRKKEKKNKKKKVRPHNDDIQGCNLSTH